MATRNPKWSRDELIVTLDFYLQHNPSIPDKRSSQISELSDFLNRLQMKLGGETGDKFRNPNGVYMKLMNFRRFDPSYEGKGLERGGKDEEVVWNLYSSNPRELRELAASIKSLVLSGDPVPPIEIMGDDEEEGEEGQILTRTHRYRERDTKLVARKKRRVLRDKGKLSCEVCDFDFAAAYGERGDGFIECHHTKPVSELRDGETTNINDLALVCSNCHRMIHRRKPWLSVGDLSKFLSPNH
jgi:5-methylcytosine-specific restriction protein A